MRRAPASAALSIALLFCACQPSRDRAMEDVIERVIASHGRESRVAINRDHGSIVVAIGGATKPSGWPDTVPIYPNANRAKIDDRASERQRLTILTEDGTKEIGDFYRARLANDGWRLEMGAGQSLQCSRGDERMTLRFSGRGKGRGSRADIEYGRAPAG